MLYLMDGDKRWRVTLVDDGTLDTVVKLSLDMGRFGHLSKEQKSAMERAASVHDSNEIEHTCRFNQEAVNRNYDGELTDADYLALARETLADYYESGRANKGRGFYGGDVHPRQDN